MSDLADILGVGAGNRGFKKGKNGSIKDDGTVLSDTKSNMQSKKKPKPLGMSREVYNLMPEGLCNLYRIDSILG